MRKSSLLLFKVQTKKKDDDDFGAPAGAVYENHSGGIVDVLEDLLNQANEQLDEIGKAERAVQFNYEKVSRAAESNLTEIEVRVGQEE